LDEDFQGCFGGGWELSEETYQTVEDAINAADEFIKDSLWVWDIVEVSPDDPTKIVRQGEPLTPYGLPDGTILSDFNLPEHSKRRKQHLDRARARFWLMVAFGSEAPEPPMPQNDTDWKVLKNIASTCRCFMPTLCYPNLNPDDLSWDFSVWVGSLVFYFLKHPERLPFKDMSDAQVLNFVYNLCGLACKHPIPHRKSLTGMRGMRGFRCEVCGETVVFLSQPLKKLPKAGEDDA
jgi:hypothetical protein